MAVVGDHKWQQIADRSALMTRLAVDDVLCLQILRIRSAYCDDCFCVRQNCKALTGRNNVVTCGLVLELDCEVVGRLGNRVESKTADAGWFENVYAKVKYRSKKKNHKKNKKPYYLQVLGRGAVGYGLQVLHGAAQWVTSCRCYISQDSWLLSFVVIIFF